MEGGLVQRQGSVELLMRSNLFNIAFHCSHESLTQSLDHLFLLVLGNTGTSLIFRSFQVRPILLSRPLFISCFTHSVVLPCHQNYEDLSMLRWCQVPCITDSKCFPRMNPQILQLVEAFNTSRVHKTAFNKQPITISSTCATIHFYSSMQSGSAPCSHMC